MRQRWILWEEALNATNVISRRVPAKLKTGRWFFTAMAIVAILTSIASFAPSMIQTNGRNGPLTLMLAVHGMVFSAWLIVFLIQTTLVITGKLALHRQLGTASIVLAVAMLVLGYFTAITMTRQGFDSSGDLRNRQDPLGGLLFPLVDLLMFAILFGAGYLYRHRGAIHKRLMLLAVFGALMPAPLAHLIGHFSALRGIPGIEPLAVGIFLAASAIYDRVALRRFHPVSLWVALAIFLVDNLCAVVILPSPAWHSFAAWLIR
jgi:hypothetical protein